MPRYRSSVCLGLFLLLGTGGGLAVGQDAGKTGSWPKVEAEEASRKYQEEAKAGALGEPSIAWLRESVVPQLAVEGNRSTIERVRRRIHDVFLNERTLDAAALEAGNRAAGAAAMKLALAAEATPLTRINAMLLVGELRGKDGRPWGAALQPLAAATADTKLPAAVRIAAMAGLSRHADAARSGTGDDFRRIAGPAVNAILAAAPAAQDPAASDWLASRALELLPVAAPQASATTAAALARMLDDGQRSFDVRVRAAAALGATATADSKIDALRTMAAMRSLAAAALEADIARADSRALDRALAGPAAAPAAGVGQPAGEPATSEPRLESLVVRRNAWRLGQLADAIARTDGQGLVRLLAADAAAPARFTAEALRKAAVDLDAAPDLATCRRALEEIRETGGEGAAKPAPASDKPASPFDN